MPTPGSHVGQHDEALQVAVGTRSPLNSPGRWLQSMFRLLHPPLQLWLLRSFSPPILINSPYCQIFSNLRVMQSNHKPVLSCGQSAALNFLHLDKSSVALIIDLLSEKVSAWTETIVNSKSPVSHSYQLFAVETLKVFNHLSQGGETSSCFLSLCQG